MMHHQWDILLQALLAAKQQHLVHLHLPPDRSEEMITMLRGQYNNGKAYPPHLITWVMMAVVMVMSILTSISLLLALSIHILFTISFPRPRQTDFTPCVWYLNCAL